MKRAIILLAYCLVVSCFNFAEAADIYEKFASLPIMQSPAISPDGNNIAAVYNSKDGPQVVLMDFPTTEFTPLAQLSRDKDRIETLAWSGNRYLIIGASYPEYYRGDTFRVERLYRLDIKTKDIRELSNSKNRKETFFKYVDYSLASTLRDDPEHILVKTYDQRDDYYTLRNPLMI
ncbi:hypothetical protein [Shewanella sp.]|uniref:hypothetical protein n=1 Tax=Shewanella sp. TaxID=50422 RepID=UPI003A971CBE